VSLPHEGWARHYDLVLARTFGQAYEDFTAQTLREIRRRVAPPARIVDFGAGTGRLAIPLAREGYRVTAVDPSGAMLAQLAENVERLGGDDTPGLRMERVASGVELYDGPIEHDLALCVFTVLGYLLDEQALTGAARSMAAALRPSGLLMIDVPGREVFEGFDIEADDVIRYVEIEPEEEGGDIFRYRERTALRSGDVQEAYVDAFTVRYWPRGKVVAALEAEGFDVEEDLSAAFEPWGADYLILRRVR